MPTSSIFVWTAFCFNFLVVVTVIGMKTFADDPTSLLLSVAAKTKRSSKWYPLLILYASLHLRKETF